MLGSPQTVTPPVGEPIAIEDAVEFVGATGNALDLRLASAIGMARAAVEATTGLRLLDQIVEIRGDGFADLARLNVAPVTAIVELAYRDPTGTEQVIDPSGYELTGAGLERGIRPAPGMSWPTIDRGGDAIRVRLAVGFGANGAAVPADLVWAMLVLIRAGIDDSQADIEPLIVNWRL